MFLRGDGKEPLLLWGREIMSVNRIRVSHFISGPVRLKAMPIKGNPPLAQKITELFAVIKGIKLVEANFLTGSLLIEYEAAELRTPDSTCRCPRSTPRRLKAF